MRWAAARPLSVAGPPNPIYPRWERDLGFYYFNRATSSGVGGHRSHSIESEKNLPRTPSSARVETRRALVFPLVTPPPHAPLITPLTADRSLSSTGLSVISPPLRGLMDDFRLLVNQCLREMLARQVTSRRSISRYARDRAVEARVTGGIGLVAADIARSLVNGHRRHLRQKVKCRVPYVRAPFVRVPDACFHFDPDSESFASLSNEESGLPSRFPFLTTIAVRLLQSAAWTRLIEGFLPCKHK